MSARAQATQERVNGHAPSWFVDAGTEQIMVPELGGWIEVKADLTHKERRTLLSRAAGYRDTDGTWKTDLGEFDILRALVWLVDWSAEDARGKRLPVNRANLEALSGPAFAAIDRALSAHDAAAQARWGKAGSAPGGKT